MAMAAAAYKQGTKCDEPEKKNKELLAYKRSAACKLAMFGLRAMREGAGIKDTDTPTWDLGNAGRKAKRSAFERALAGLEGVSGAAVLAIDGALVAVVEAAEPSARRWATALAEELPAWAVPSRFEAVEALPRTPRGKVDVTAVAELLPGTRR